MDWISVKDRKPEILVPVLVYMEHLHERYGICYFNWDGYWISYYQSWKPPYQGVTYWMPLPKAPKEE